MTRIFPILYLNQVLCVPKYNHKNTNHALVASGYCFIRAGIVGKQIKYVFSEHFAVMCNVSSGLQNICFFDKTVKAYVH